ncbi:MAG: response regulator [bacterium]
MGARKKILIVEDDKLLLDSLATALSSENYEVLQAKNGKFGLEQALLHYPDLIICDIMMPEYDGYWLLENIHNKKILMSTPFIFISAKAEREDLRKGMVLGADDYLTKPFRITELLDAVKSRFAKHENIKAAITSDARTKEKIDSGNFIVIDTGSILEKIRIDSIELIAADNIYSNVHLIDGKIIVVRKSMNEWERLLPEELFVRIHRATIVNLEFVNQIEKWFNQTLRIYMKNHKEPQIASRGYYKKLKRKFII